MMDQSMQDGVGKPFQQKYKCDWLSWKRFCVILRILFPSFTSTISVLFLLLLICSVAEQFLIYFVGLIPSKFYYVLGYGDMAGFIQETWRALLLIVCIALAKSSKQYISSLLFVKWRDLLTSYLHQIYLKDICYYQLNVLKVGMVDDPDQRIADDAKQLCQKFSSMVSLLLISPFTIIYYTVKVTQATGYIGPVCIYLFFLITNFVNKFIMSPVVNLKVKQEQQEGQFRFKHMQIRSNSESIAFFKANDVELCSTDKKLSNLLETLTHYVNREFWLHVSMNICDYVGSIVSYIIIAIPVFRGVYSDMGPQDISSLVSANSFICMYLIYSFTQLIDLSNQVSDIAGLSHRIGELTETLLGMNTDHKETSSSKDDGSSFKHHKLINEDDDEQEEGAELSDKDTWQPLDKNVLFKIQGLSIYPPNSGNILIEDLSFTISSGKNVLISGDSGSGKTSLLRTLHGLWPHIGGSIHRQNLQHRDLMFLPQKPYMIDGTLEEQIIYPEKIGTVTINKKENLIDLLHLVGLEKLLTCVQGLRGQVVLNWYNILTPGEMQKITFARLFYHRPKLALLDEATSALSVAMEAKLYKLCATYNMTLVTVGHRASLRQFHSSELQLHGNGYWKLADIKRIDVSKTRGMFSQ